jgi:acyl dehydratase
MNISTGIVGTTVGPRVHAIDARWLMAYAAALGDAVPDFVDTARPDGILAHPLFPVCYEWPLALDLRAKTLSDDIAIRGVHATHDLTIHRRPRPGDRLSTTAAITAVEARSPGAYVALRFETVDAAGRPVTTTDYGSLYLGVGCGGSTSRGAADEPQARSATRRAQKDKGVAEPPDWSTDVAVPANLAHVYTECARIWNPIHTDRAVALAAGLPDIILHGTATLALAVSAVLRHERGGPALPVARITCRFAGMVRLPSTLRVEGWVEAASPAGRVIRFQALAADGRPAVRDGRMTVAS